MVRLYPGLVVRGACTPDLAPSCDGGEPGGVGGEAATRSALATPTRSAPYSIHTWYYSPASLSKNFGCTLSMTGYPAGFYDAP